MHRCSSLAAILALTAFSASAQVSSDEDFLETEAARRVRENSSIFIEPKTNQITAGKFSYDGLAVQLAVVDNPFQLINPAASEGYGSSENNLVRDPITDRPSGLKLFSLNF